MHQQTNKGIKVGLKTFSSHIYWANLPAFLLLMSLVLDVSNLDYLLIVFLQAGAVEKNQNKQYLKFEIRQVQINVLPRTLVSELRSNIFFA